jgi:ankyrin repeat protein
MQAQLTAMNADKNVPPNLVQGFDILGLSEAGMNSHTRFIVLCPHRSRQLLDGQLVDKVQIFREHHGIELLLLYFVQVVHLLLQRGAAVDAQDSDGQTPLHYAALNEQQQVCSTLGSALRTFVSVFRFNNPHSWHCRGL